MEIHTGWNDSQAAFATQKSECFRLLAIYDTESAESEAASASGLVEEELGDDVVVEKSFWKLEAFRSQMMRECAAVEALEADMIILSLGANSDLAALKRWIASWQKNRKQDGGLITLLHDGSDPELRDFLAEAALTANMDFLCRSSENRLE
jgi:hypothetical protein